MVNFGYPYNDIVICTDSTDYLTIRQSANNRLVFLRRSLVLVLVYTQEGSLWSIVLRCDDHTGIFTCDGCARDPYFYVPAETQSYVIKLSCSRKVLAASGDWTRNLWVTTISSQPRYPLCQQDGIRLQNQQIYKNRTKTIIDNEQSIFILRYYAQN